MTTTPSGPDGPESPPTRSPDDDAMPAGAVETLALVQEQQQRVEGALGVDARLILGVWGGAWLAGFLLLWAASPLRETPILDIPPALAGGGFAAMLLAAAVISSVHIAGATSGLRGVSAQASAMYGWSWMLGFVSLGLVMAAVGRVAQSREVDALLWPALSGLVVGLLYLAGGAVYRDRLQFGIGVWILITAVTGAWAGVPTNYLVMALAGGGCFLLASAGFAVHGARQRETQREMR